MESGHRATVGNACVSTIFVLCKAFMRLVRPPRMQTKHVLKDLCGVIRPGRATLILGPPGSGRTSLLQLLSGRLGNIKPGSGNMDFTGTVSFQGKDVKNLHLPHHSCYVSQHDDHHALLTARETVQFAFDSSNNMARWDQKRFTEMLRLRVGEEGVKRLRQAKELEVDLVMSILGLSNCADTIIGADTYIFKYCPWYYKRTQKIGVQRRGAQRAVARGVKAGSCGFMLDR